MSDAIISASATTAPAQVGSPKKSAAGGKQAAAGAGSKKPRVKPAHPPTSEMVLAAVKNLKERQGSSLQAIKKYITQNYQLDAEKLAPFIRKYLKSAVTTGALVQTKGKGASGSFKLSTSDKSGEGGKKVASSSAKSPKKSAAVAKKSKVAKAKTSAAKPPAAKKLTKKTAASPAKAKNALKHPLYSSPATKSYFKHKV